MTRIPLRTIYDIKNKINTCGNIDRKPGSGRKSKLRTNDKKRIPNIANPNPKIASSNGILTIKYIFI